MNEAQMKMTAILPTVVAALYLYVRIEGSFHRCKVADSSVGS